MSGMLEHEDGASKLDPGSGAFALLRQNPAADDSLDSTRLLSGSPETGTYLVLDLKSVPFPSLPRLLASAHIAHS